MPAFSKQRGSPRSTQVEAGFYFIPIIIAIVVLIVAVIAVFNLFINNSSFYTTAMMSKEEKLKNKPTIYNIGVNFDKFDPATGKAGDFLFIKEKGYDNRLFLEFGYLVKNDRGEKILPSPTYFVPQGTKVIAVSSGKIVDIRSQSDTNDYELVIQPKDAPGWRISYDHLQSIKFKKGAEVNTADIVGESGNYTMTEITVFVEGTRPEDIINFCSFMLLENSVKEKYAQKLLQFVRDWETYTGNPEMYDEKSWIFPGCRYEKLNEADTIR